MAKRKAAGKTSHDAWCAIGTCPVFVDGPGQARTDLAHDAVHQASVLLNFALAEVEPNSGAKDDLVSHALLLRAGRLLEAASMLLSDPDDVEGIKRSRGVVLGAG